MIKHLIKGGMVIDPSQELLGIYDILIEGERIKRIDEEIFEPEAEIIDAKGLIVAPGFVDLHVHFRDPGQTYKEDILSGSKAAVAGGYTTVVCMPNTEPPIDSPEVVEYVKAKSKCWGICNVLPAGTVTRGRKGKELSDLWALKEAGCVAFTDDGAPVIDSSLMKKALELSAQLKAPVMNHCEDDRVAMGAINEGEVSALLGLSSRPPEAEDMLNARDCVLSYYTGGHVHIQHLTTALGVDIIRYFKGKGARVTCEVNPYHLLFTEEELLRSGANAKVNPPLRKKEDVEALREALSDGTIDCVATDHAPHAVFEKGRVDTAMPGIIGLQTALPVMLELVAKEYLSLIKLVELMSTNPAKIIGIEAGTLAEGAPADIVIFDLKKEWILDDETNFSKSRNTPLWGKTLTGKVIYTIKGGKVVYKD
ncbi:dihydroorotase [Hydrogenivirga caldilitoris]|uniref:Dihydroorotase n=1 Tax=Hydrogenivirga caldilitoris TaxID=246264 RepID=A0A497XMD0_9AQUI|nr:dihydroorotase [Hydrogenivirga caldilitoris]RLJ69968.1 dihydroorotase [Hydrogenivirga caldilitoris]